MNLGIEIGGTKLQIVVGDASAKIQERRRLDVNPQRGGVGIREQIESTLGDLLPRFKPAAIGVGFGGPVDWNTGRICRSHQIEGWTDFKLGAWLASIANVPVRVENDANTATLGEALHGAGVGFSPVFYVTLGSGVGGGLVVDGNIYHGATPGEAEIGHVRLDKSGTIVESRCSGWAVDRRIREMIKATPDSPLARLCVGSTSGEARFLVAAMQKSDPGARRILEETAEDLAFGLSHVVQLFHPEVIVVGGGLSLMGEPLRAGVEVALRRFTMEAFAPGPAIRLAALGEDAVPVGALELARRELKLATRADR